MALKDDPKLAALVGEALRAILRRARREAANEEDFRDKRKVVIFSYFADTVDWIMDFLEEVLRTDKALAPYRGRLAGVTGSESYRGVSREDAIFGFAPRSSEAPPGRDEDRFDILVTTDVLAEGMNLQQCRNVVNYDLPWNPMRLVQRHGRIDRIGSLHDHVYIWCFFPDVRLEALLDLESRIRRKVAQAAATVGVEHEVIPGAARSDIVFAETREEIERLQARDASLLVLACLRLIGCKEDAPTHLPEEMKEAAYEAWACARRDIFDEWQFATDPANLQPKVRPALRAAAGHLRKFPPPPLTQEEIDAVIDAVEAPWGMRIEKQIREALASSDGVDASRRIVDTVRQLGLEPFRAPEPLPPIEEEDVTLICWLAVDAAG
ncbi:MAG: hypothetical protein FJW34_19310 [Acidobacteria bacterium]|nr:hypothetical protein [Acidobacteriota bacterium]